MTFNLDELTVIYPEQLWLELSEKEQENAWQQTTQEPYSSASARWRAFINRLCLNSISTWFKEQEKLETKLQSTDLPSFWEVVNGTALKMHETRLVLIPTDKSNLQEFRIPQEWVNISSWAANYYLAVQLNLEANWLRVWGYATHQQIQEEAKYDPMDRTYSLDKEDLIENIEIMLVAQELCPPKKPEVKSLPTFSKAQTEKFLEQLSKTTLYSPRLDVPFEQWATLMASAETRERLYQLRHENIKGNTVELIPLSVNNLSQWFQDIFDAGWQNLDALISPAQRTFAVQFRSDSALNEVRIKGAKLIDLGMQIGSISIVLLVGLTPELDEKVGIRVQLYPANGETYLPPNLRLALLSSAGTTLQEITSRSHDNYIQMKRFKSPLGKSFSIEVALGEISIKENFMFEPLVGI